MIKQKKYNQSKDVTDNIRIAMYIRLSKVDTKGTGQEESNSISMQRILIKKYIVSHFTSFQIVEYKDMKIANLIQSAGIEYHRKGKNKGFRHIRHMRKPLLIL